MLKIFNNRAFAFLVVATIVVSTFFRQELYDFFLSPDGLSLAKSEICVINKSDKEPVVKIIVVNGATVSGLLFADEKLCSPSPHKQTSGFIQISIEDGVPPFCKRTMETGGDVILSSFDSAGQCGWGDK